MKVMLHEDTAKKAKELGDFFNALSFGSVLGLELKNEVEVKELLNKLNQVQSEVSQLSTTLHSYVMLMTGIEKFEKSAE